jgi:sigma-E factor negative regulatory protein RseC
MIEENGRVVEVDDGGVWIETIKASACASCAAKSGCGQKLLASIGEGKRFVFAVSNPELISVEVDDNVLIGIEEGSFLKATLFMYLLPLAALFFGAFVSQVAGLSEGYVILLSIFSFAIGLLVVRFFSGIFFASCQYQPRLLKLL